MELLFTNCTSNDEHIRNEADKEIVNRIDKDHYFVKDLLSFLGEALNADLNPNLIKLVCIVIKETIKVQFGNKLPDLSLSEFMLSNLMDYVFILPFDDREFLINSLHIFFYQTEFSSHIAETCFEQISSDSFANTSTSISIISHLIIVCASENRYDEVENYYSSFIQLVLENLPQYIDYFENKESNQPTIEEKEEYEISELATLSIIDLCMYLIKKPQKLIDLDSELKFFNVTVEVISLLQISNISDIFQKSICEYINSLIHCLFFKDQLFQSKEFASEIRGYFIENILPSVSQTVFTCFTYDNFDSVASSYLLLVVCLMVQKKWFLDDILTENFISNVIIPLCYIPDHYLQDFVDIPENFIAYYYSDPSKGNDPDLISFRIYTKKLLNIIGMHFDDALDMILSCCTSDFLEGEDDLQNQLDFESRLFVISCITKYRPEEEEIYDFLLHIVQTEDEKQTPFLIATALRALKYMKINTEYLNSLSLDILVQSDLTIIRLFALKLFKKTFNPQNPVFNIPTSTLLPILIDLANEVTSKTPSNIIDLLIRQFPDLIVENASDLITSLLETWMKLYNEQERYDIQRYLNLVILIIQKINDPRLFEEKSEELCNFFYCAINQSINNKESYDDLNDFFDIINALVEKIDEPDQDLYQIIPFVRDFFCDNINQNYQWIKFAIKLFISFAKKANFFQFEEGFIANELIEFCGWVIDNCDFTSPISSIFIFYSEIIQITEGQKIDLADQAIQYFSQDIEEPILFVSALVLLSSALLTNSDYIIRNIDDHIILNISDNIHILRNSEENYINICLIGLCILAKSRNEKSYLTAVSVLQIIFNDIEKSDQDFFSDEISCSIDNTYPYSLPSDKLNPLDFFIKVSEETGYLEKLLTQEEQEFILENINGIN